MKTIGIELKMFNYIAHPFWPARNQVIEIEKRSGCNRQKSDDKRVAAIKAECAKQGLTYDRYFELVEEAKDQWYRRDGNIIIPRHQLAGALVQTIASAPKALRGSFDKDNFRALVQIGDFVTDRKKCDGVFSRFVKLDGSNQRSFQENEYLGVYLDRGEPFAATGQIAVADAKAEETIKAILRAAVETIGVGAARKMGFGRGAIVKWN